MKYALIGFEYNNIWKVPVMFAGEIEDAAFYHAEDIWDATTFETAELAEENRGYLQKDYPDYTWYVIIIPE